MSRILDQFGRPFGTAPAPAPEPRGPRPVSNRENERLLRARFDSQFTTDDNRRHWALADAMSIDASASWMVRRQLRMRSRYEYHNNSYYMGMADTIGNYVIGTGPRLQMTTPDKALNAAVEKAWAEWSREVGLARTLKSMRVARLVNGEAFALLRSNPNLFHPVKLDVFEVECDQVSSPLFGMYPSQYPDQFFDGVVLDPWGRPEKYHVLRQHPGAFGAFVMMGYEFDTWPARYVLHDYKPVRPGQQRGIPETTPALELFAEFRRYTKAVVAAAETVADYAMTLESTGPAMAGDGGGGDDEDFNPMDTVDLKRRMATVLPAGWKMNQTRAEQPTTTYKMFADAILCEIARCLNFPVMFASLDARQANMASAYVVTQPFVKSVVFDRGVIYEPLLDRLLDEFLTEAVRVPGLLPKRLPAEFPHAWRWPRVGHHADPAKVATGHEKALRNGTTSIPLLCAEEGQDWEEVQTSNAKSLGMSLEEYRAALRQYMFAAPGTPAPASTDPEPDPEDPDTPDPDAPEDDTEGDDADDE